MNDESGTARSRAETNDAIPRQAPSPALPHVEERGLSDAEVSERVEAGQTNRVKTSTSRSLSQIVRANVFTLFNAIIFTAMVLVLLTGSWRDAVFGLVIVVNTAIGIFTEIKAKVTLDRLSILVAASYSVRRDGRDVDVSHDQIVLGDLLWIRAGEQVPADAKVKQVWGVELDESMLTGESRTVKKQLDEVVYSGSTVVAGLALVEVQAVGEHSYAASLTAKAKVYTKQLSDLSRGINTILKYMTFIVVPLCMLLVWSQMRTVGGLQQAISTGLWRQAVVSSVAGVVGMIPEGLVLLTSLNFAIAAIRLARHNTLVQELESVETLARVDCLNLDKTGTITDGGINFDELLPLDDSPTKQVDGQTDDQAVMQKSEHEDEHMLRQVLYDLVDEPQPNASGSAIVKGLAGDGVTPGQVEARTPFSSARKWSAIKEESSSWFLGAPEVLLDAMDGNHDAVRERIRDHAAKGQRVMLIARARSQSIDDLPGTAQPVALVLLSEHIRDDALPTLKWFHEQGVRCRLISGDNPDTVGSIAAHVKLNGSEHPRVKDARTLPGNVEELADVLDDVDVLGRVMPEQKKLIVQALQSRDHVVAMSGDGVNDALAIKQADLGIAMGNAAPATKAVAQVVLVDSKFSHLPEVVARGRQVMANMERVAGLFLVKTTYSALIALGVVLTAIPFPYLPRHITYVGSLTIGIPAFLLALAPNTRRYVPGFLRRVLRFAIPAGFAIALSVLIAAWALPGIMEWSLNDPADLSELRATCTIIIFASGIFVLGRVARPLASWRGVLVAIMAAIGVVGVYTPIVADFFALHPPTWATVIATLIALLIESGIALLEYYGARAVEQVTSGKTVGVK